MNEVQTMVCKTDKQAALLVERVILQPNMCHNPAAATWLYMLSVALDRSLEQAMREEGGGT